jgi:hypothetical protein
MILTHSEDDCILFGICLNSVPLHHNSGGAPASTLRVPGKHKVVHSAGSGALGGLWTDGCCCSEQLSSLVMTSAPFDIFMMDRDHGETMGEM